MPKNIDWIKFSLIGGIGLCLLGLLREWDKFDSERSQLSDLSQLEQRSDYSSDNESENSTILIPSDHSAEGSSKEKDSAYSESGVLSQFEAQDSGAGLTVAEDKNASNGANNTHSNRIIEIETDVLNLKVDLKGGDVIEASLLQYDRRKDDSTPLKLLVDNSQHQYIARSGIKGKNSGYSQSEQLRYQSQFSSYRLEEGVNQLVVDLTYQQGNTQLIKRFRFDRSKYSIDVEYLIENSSASELEVFFYAQLDRDAYIPPSDVGIGVNPYVGPALTTPDDRYKKVKFKDLDKQAYSETVNEGWVAILQHYFVSAWIPRQTGPIHYELSKDDSSGLYHVRIVQSQRIAPGEIANIGAVLYIGPKDQYILRDLAEYLDLTVDYGWLWWAAQPLYAILYFIQSGEIHSFNLDLKLFPGFINWGLSIILLTLVVKLLFFPLSAASYKSMARMRTLTPKMTALRERYGEDRQALSQEMMKLYQKEKINPLGGCLPILVQMPIFIALYWVLLESVEIRHAPFFGWIQDLSAKDPLFILPLIMGASMWFQQKLNPPPPDPMQARVMQLMPIMFTVMFMFFPAGLVLYWTVNNLLSISQQWLITRKIEQAA